MDAGWGAGGGGLGGGPRVAPDHDGSAAASEATRCRLGGGGNDGAAFKGPMFAAWGSGTAARKSRGG